MAASKQIGIGLMGFGRVGRGLFRELWRRDGALRVAAVAEINPGGRDPAQLTADLAYLLAHDPVYGRFPGRVGATGAQLLVDGRPVPVLLGGQPRQVDWGGLGARVLVEASGDQAAADAAAGLAGAGVDKVVITRSARTADATLVRGLNLATYDPARHHVISCSTCTANALAPVLGVLDEAFGVASAGIATIHPALSGDTLLDAPAVEASAGRSGLGVRPVSSEVARTTAQLLPRLEGRLMAMSFRVPTLLVNALLADLVLERPPADRERVIAVLREATAGPLKDVAALEEGFLGRPRVAADFLGDPHSARVDLNWLELRGPQLRVLLWHDNEHAYCCRVADTLEEIARHLA
ncbi:MAG: glyceraldehyde 3-phosphate dehydrogenase NAD-binding domain-containing protein [Pseudomonadota bacterium]